MVCHRTPAASGREAATSTARCHQALALKVLSYPRGESTLRLASYPRRPSINVCATQNTSPTGSHASGHGPASTAGLSLANSHTPPRFDELMDAEPGSAEFDELDILADLVAHDEGKHEPMG